MSTCQATSASTSSRRNGLPCTMSRPSYSACSLCSVSPTMHRHSMRKPQICGLATRKSTSGCCSNDTAQSRSSKLLLSSIVSRSLFLLVWFVRSQERSIHHNVLLPVSCLWQRPATNEGALDILRQNELPRALLCSCDAIKEASCEQCWQVQLIGRVVRVDECLHLLIRHSLPISHRSQVMFLLQSPCINIAKLLRFEHEERL